MKLALLQYVLTGLCRERLPQRTHFDWQSRCLFIVIFALSPLFGYLETVLNLLYLRQNNSLLQCFFDSKFCLMAPYHGRIDVLYFLFIFSALHFSFTLLSTYFCSKVSYQWNISFFSLLILGLKVFLVADCKPS